MENIYDKIVAHMKGAMNNNQGVAAVEIILILVVLIGLVVIFKSQAISLVNKIWNAINDGAGTVTG